MATRLIKIENYIVRLLYLWKRRQTEQQRPFLSICAYVYYLKLSPLLIVKNVLTPTQLFPSIMAQPVVNFRCPDMTTEIKALSSRSHNFPLEDLFNSICKFMHTTYRFLWSLDSLTISIALLRNDYCGCGVLLSTFGQNLWPTRWLPV